MLRLRDLRKKSGLTMKELGKKFGMAESTISQYETGKRQPDYEILLKFSDFFGVSTDYILTGKEKQEKPIPVGEDGLDEQDRQLVDLMKKLSADQKAFLLAQLLTLTEQGK